MFRGVADSPFCRAALFPSLSLSLPLLSSSLPLQVKMDTLSNRAERLSVQASIKRTFYLGALLGLISLVGVCVVLLRMFSPSLLHSSIIS